MNKLLALTAVLLVFAGFWLYSYDSPNYKFLDFLSKFITAAGIFIAVLAYYASTRKDKAEGDRAKNAIAFSLINQWQMPPFTDYIADINKMERIDRTTRELFKNKNADDFVSLLEVPFYAHYRRSLICIFNFFEHIAISLDRKVAGEDYIKDFYKSIFIDFQEQYTFYITHEQKRVPDLWINFINLAEKWKIDNAGQERKKWERFQFIYKILFYANE